MGQTLITTIGRTYPGLEEAITKHGGTLIADSNQAQGLVVSFGGGPGELLETVTSAPNVEWVQLPSAGIELYRESLTARPDLTWTSAKGAYALPVAEHALALTLALLRELPTRVRARSWAPASGTSLHGLRTVVIGAGGVGVEIVRLLKCFDTHVTVVRRLPEDSPGADTTVTGTDLEAVLPEADVVILAAALTDNTRHLFDQHRLGLLKSHAILINIARGGLIDTRALTEVLASQSIAGAALDVTDPEPLPDGHPLWRESRALITPHAADTLEMIQPLFAERLAANVSRFQAGQALLGVVDPVVGY